MAATFASAPLRVVVLGGGFAGLEAAFYMRWRAHDRVDLTLVSDSDHFLFKPNTIYIPFGLNPEKLKIPLDGPTRRQRIRLVQGSAREIDPDRRIVTVDGGLGAAAGAAAPTIEEIPYDRLVVATGAAMRPQEVPGLVDHAHTIWTPADMLRLRAALAEVLADAQAGRRRRVAFLVPPNNKCSGPLYEIVFMLDTWLRRNGARDVVDLTWLTYEKGFIQAFGPRLHETVAAEYGTRHVDGRTGWVVEEVRPDEVVSTSGERVPYDLLISFPPYVAATEFAGLGADERGFLPTDLASRRVIGHDDIYAAGDAGDFPVKQAFLAFLQADAAADGIAAEALGTTPSLAFDPTSMCVMEQFDHATFAQVPLRLTGDPERPVEVRPDANGQYRVGTSVPWRAGKKLLGLYLPWRFRAGKPFHAGAPWTAMDAGLKVMAKTMAK